MGRVFLYGFLLLATSFFLLPVYLVVLTALKEPAKITLDAVWRWPDPVYWESFRTAWEAFRPKFQNSAVLALSATALSALVGALNGYVLAKWPFRGSNLLFALMLFGMFIPYQSVLIPLVQTLMKLGLYGKIPGLILTHIVYGIPITTLIFRNYYATIPTELVEAAKVDGAGILGIYRRVILPLSWPGFVVVMIWQFTSIWNDFLFAVTIAQDPLVQPVTVALNNLAGSFIVEWNVQMAGALLAALPTLLVYIFLGRYFMRGLLAGSLKG